MSMTYNKQSEENDRRFVVTEHSTLLKWLIENVEGNSRSRLKAILQGRGVRVDGKCVTQFDYPLEPGMQLEVSKSKRNEVFKSRYFRIIYEDRYLIVVDKNEGVLSMAAGHSSLNLKALLDDYFVKTHQRCRAHVVHRLDRDTSGLMVYAKDMETEQVLEYNWHEIVYDRRYIAVVSGEVIDDAGTITSWLRENNGYLIYSSPVDNGGKYAVTHFSVLDRTTTHSLVEFQLETGRKNQIRVHSSDIGHPVCGDVKYGNGDNPIDRLCLHAYILCFFHPVTNARMEFSTPIPPNFKRIFK